MAANTDYYDIYPGQRHRDEVEYMHGVSAPLVAELELDAATLTPGEAQALDFARPLPSGALLLSAWVEGDAMTSSDPNTAGALVKLGPSGGDEDGWVVAVDLFVEGPRQGAAGELWVSPCAPILAIETLPAATILASGNAPDLAHLTGTVKIKILYRRTVGEAPE